MGGAEKEEGRYGGRAHTGSQRRKRQESEGERHPHLGWGSRCVSAHHRNLKRKTHAEVSKRHMERDRRRRYRWRGRPVTETLPALCLTYFKKNM